jgi:hypothetical protein
MRIMLKNEATYFDMYSELDFSIDMNRIDRVNYNHLPTEL